MWKSSNRLSYEKITGEVREKNQFFIDDIVEDETDIIINVRFQEACSGKFIEREYRRNKKQLGLE